MKTSFTLSLLLSVLFVTVTACAFADVSNFSSGQIHMQADTIEYIRDQGLVMAKGQVHIQQGSNNLYADAIRYETDSQDVQANGHVVFQDGTQTVETESLTYNLRTHKGKAFNIKTTSPPWITTGGEVDIEPSKIIIKTAIATTCDYSPEYRHYHMEADKITIYSNDYLVAENVIFYIGKVPIFYFPFFVKAIHDVRTPFSFSTGSTDYLGNYLLLTNNYLFSPTNYGALYTDYFSKQGIGLGVRHEISLNDYSAFSLYGYAIQEKSSNDLRWESRLRGLWAVSSNLQGRIEADLPGDGMFSQDYSVARRDPTLVSTLREYDISGTLTTQQSTFGLLLRRQEMPDTSDPVDDPNETHFIESLQNLPQINFSLFPQPFLDKHLLKYDLTLNGDHTYTQTNGYYVNHLQGEFGLSASQVFLKTQTLYTRVALDETYQDVSDAGVTQGLGAAGDTGTVNVSSTWSGRWSEIYNTNLTYSFTKKLNNLLPYDTADGISTNLLSGYMEFTAGSLLRARTSESYDFAVQVIPQGARLSYLNQQFYFTPVPQFDYMAILDYSVQANALKDFNSVLDYKSTKDLWRFRLSGNFVDPNVSNTGYISQGTPPTFEIAGEVDLSVFTNYRVSALESYDCTNAKFESRSVSLYRDLHDWEAQIGYSNDPVNGEQVFFTLNLKALPGRPLSVSDQQLQSLNGVRNTGLTGTAAQFQ